MSVVSNAIVVAMGITSKSSPGAHRPSHRHRQRDVGQHVVSTFKTPSPALSVVTVVAIDT